MNDARHKEIQRVLTLIGEAKGVLELDEEEERAEDVVDALERAAMACGDAITACKEAIHG